MSTCLNICATVFGQDNDRESCLKKAGLVNSNGSDNGNWNVFLGEVVKIPLTSNGSQSTSDCYSLGLTSVAYDKGLYTPGTLKLTFTVTGSASSVTLENALIQTFSGIRTSLFGYNELARTEQANGTVKITYSNIIYILKDYYLQSVKETDSGKSCVLTWRSPDYELTREKGCEVFEAKRFGKDIFSAKAGAVSLSEDGSVKMRYACGPERLLLMGYNQDYKLKCRDGKHDEEIIHPYLVRYNESVYDFMVRVAHRCGEFLYFEYDEEGGKFCLGLPEETVKHIVDGSGYNVDEDNELYCSYRDLGGLNDEDAAEFSTDFMTCADQTDKEGCYYDMQNTSDDFLYRLKDSDEPSLSLDAAQEIYKALSPIFTANDLISGLTAAGSVVLQDIINTEWLFQDKRSDQYETYKDECNAANSDMLAYDTYKVMNLNNHFYHFVETNERKSERHSAVLNFSNHLPQVKIGDDINLNDGLYDAYLVSRVYGSFSYSEAASSGTTGTDASVKAENHAEVVPVMAVEGLDKLPRMAFPPALGISHSVKVSSMEAIVVRTDDPLMNGRVKVRYPWQQNEDGDPDDSTDTPKTSRIPLSPWIRVAVPYTGTTPGSGFSMPLSVGEHVMLNYSDGNIERPYVAGSLYFRSRNGDGEYEPHSPGQGNFDDTDADFYKTGFQTRSILSGKGHGLMFKDTGDTSPITALFPIFGVVEQIVKAATGAESYGVDCFKGGGIALGDGTGLLTVELDADKRNIDFTSELGSISASAFTGITINVPNGDIDIKGKNVNIEAGNNLTLKSGTNIMTESRNNDYYGELFGTLLGNSLTQLLKKTTDVDLSGCLDLSFIRCVMEIVLRPVEGTLRIQSGRNTVVTAGPGNVTIPTSLLSDRSRGANGLPLCPAVQKAVECVDSFIKEGMDRRKKLAQCIVDFQTSIKEDNTLTILGDYANYSDPSKVNEVIKKFCIDGGKLDKVDAIFNYSAADRSKCDTAYKKIGKTSDKMMSAAEKYKSDIIEAGYLDKQFKNVIGKMGFTVERSKFNADWQELQPGASEEEKWKEWYTGDQPNADVILCQKQMARDAVLQIILGSDKIRILHSATDVNTLVSAESNDVKNNGKPEEWTHYYKEGDLSKLKDYIRGTTDKLWTTLRDAVINAPDDDDDDEKESGEGIRILQGLGKGIASTLGGIYDSEDDKWAPQTKKLLNIGGEAGPRAFSEISTSGGIMFSNHKGRTLKVSEDTKTWESFDNGDNATALSALLESLDNRLA